MVGGHGPQTYHKNGGLRYLATVINGTTPIRGVLAEEAFVDQILRNLSAVTESDIVSTLGRNPRRPRDAGN